MRVRITQAFCLVTLLMSLNVGAATNEDSNGSPPVKSILQRPALNSGQVASLVKQQCQGCRILSVTSSSRGAGIYRVKTLSGQGVVKYVFVDSQSGAIR